MNCNIPTKRLPKNIAKLDNAVIKISCFYAIDVISCADKILKFPIMQKPMIPIKARRINLFSRVN